MTRIPGVFFGGRGINRRQLMCGTLACAAPSLMGSALAQSGIRRVGWLGSLSASDPDAQIRIAALQEGLKELGWIEGRNLHLEVRWAGGEGEELRALAHNLVALKPDLIIGQATPAVAALLAETRMIPILFAPVTDPVGLGFVASLARPGGNVTGFLTFEFSMGGKWLQTLKEIAPKVARVAILFNPETAPFSASFVRVIEGAASSLGVQPVSTPVREERDYASAIASFAKEPNGGLIVLPDAFNTGNREQIIAGAARHRLPAVYPFRYFSASGGLISDGVNMPDQYRRAASYVDMILKGANPGELPVQAPTKYELVINLKTAQALGLTVPPILLARADEVIE
jgi:putative ABC transport system substrate-binding protein